MRVSVMKPKHETVTIRTHRRCELVDITREVQTHLERCGAETGVALIYCPHTTAGITINEGADPDVCRDILDFLESLVPQNRNFRHVEGNSDSHIKTSWVGASEHVIIEDGHLLLGQWQRIFFCEFDGPRKRRFFVKVIPDI